MPNKKKQGDGDVSLVIKKAKTAKSSANEGGKE
jgi:hypothetical protein